MPISYNFSTASDLNGYEEIDPQREVSSSGRVDTNVRRSLSPARRNRQSTPNATVGSLPATRFSYGSDTLRPASSSASSFNGWMGRKVKEWKGWCRRRGIIWLLVLVAVFFFVNSWMLYRIRDPYRASGIKFKYLKMNSSTVSIQEELVKLGRGRRPQKTIYARLLAKASHSLAERLNKPEPKDLWEEPYVRASTWKPCADQRAWERSEGSNGYIMVSANGGINQQRVAVRFAMLLLLPDYLMQHLFFHT